MKIAWTLLANYTGFFVAVETRCARFDELYEWKLKALEHHYAVERLKIPSEILNSKVIMQANVSIIF
jgi:hypothetical protein